MLSVRDLALTFPPIAPPVGIYLGGVLVDRTAYVGGHGDAGRHTRAAAGMAKLPFDMAVEVEMASAVRD